MLRLEPRLTSVHTLAFSPDNRYLLAVGAKSGLGGLLQFDRFALHDLSDPAATPTLPIDDRIDPIAGFFLPDGRALGVDDRGSWAVARPGALDADVSSVLCKTPSGRLLPAAVSPDGRWLALTGSASLQCVPLPAAGEGAEPWEVRPGHSREVLAAAFSPDGDALAAVIRHSRHPPAESEGALIAPLSRPESRTFEWFDVAPEADRVAWSPDGRFLVTLAPRWFGAWDVRARSLAAARVTGERGSAHRVFAFHPAGGSLVVADWQGRVQFWDTAEWGGAADDRDRPPARTLEWGVGGIQALAFSPDGSLGAVAGKSGEVVVWDAE